MSLADTFYSEPSERIAEIGALLARALVRIHIHKSSGFAAEFGESSLHFSPDQSSDASPCSAEISDG